MHESGAMFRAEGATLVVEPTARGIRQGHIETSNVDMLGSMVDMINVQRAYAAVHSGLRAIDGVMDTIANDIGRVG
jgi:flagellar basal-body rod protein FlgG